MSLLLGCIALVSFVSISSWIYCWRDVQRGRPHILSLRQVTMIMDRNVLDKLYGKHEPGYYYSLNESALKQLNANRKLPVYGEMLADMICFWGAYRYFSGIASVDSMQLFTLLAIVYQGLSIWHSMMLVRKWWPQIQEEIENERDGL